MWAILWLQFFSNVYLNLFSDVCFTAVFLLLFNRPPFFFQYEICFSNVLDFLFVSTRALLPCGGQNPCSKGGAWVSGLLLHARESVKHMHWALPWSDRLPSGWWIHSPYIFTCRFYQNSKIIFQKISACVFLSLYIVSMHLISSVYILCHREKNAKS